MINIEIEGEIVYNIVEVVNHWADNVYISIVYTVNKPSRT